MTRPTTLAGPTIVVDSGIWKVYPAGRITVYGKDEFGLLFELGTGPERKRRFTRYSPLGSKSTDASLAELTERQLLDFFHQSQPAWTSPEGGYGDALADPREVAADGKDRLHPVDRDGNHPRPSRKNQQPRSRSSRAHGAVPGPGALGKERHPAAG